MSNPWFRLWTDMVNDPKWRTIARKSGQKIGDVIAVYVHMMTCASNATERGRTQGWCDEDVATALDIDIEQVVAIREAMQGRVLDGDYLTGWEKRQPIKEDGSAERAKQWREEQKRLKEEQLSNDGERERTKTNAREEEIREDKEQKTLSGRPDAVEVLDYLNLKTGKAYQPVEANLRLISGRLESSTIEQCKAIIDSKVVKWGGDPKMKDYLRPKTLFNATNFAQYIGDLGGNSSQPIVRKDSRFAGAL